jgi:hypothetical protein
MPVVLSPTDGPDLGAPFPQRDITPPDGGEEGFVACMPAPSRP